MKSLIKKLGLGVILASSVLLFLGAATGIAATLTVGHGSGYAGDSVVIPITLTNTVGNRAAGFQVDLYYDATRLEILSVEIGARASAAGKSLSMYPIDQLPIGGPVRCLIYGLQSTPKPEIQDGEVLKFTFRIKAGAPTGNADLTLSNGMFLNANDLVITNNILTGNNITVQTVATYNLNVIASNGNVVKRVSGIINEGPYAPGTVVSLTATGNVGYHFTSWAGSLSGSVNPTTITMDSDKTVTANFALDNRAPIANAQSVAAVEDTAKAITLTGTDADGDALTYAIVTQPAHGALSGAAPNVTYIPAANYNGADSFTFKVNDGKVDSANATVSITVAAVNDAPVANNQSLSVVDNATLNITLTATDIEGSALTYTVLTQPAHGVLSNTAPNLVYTPALNYVGADSFTFRASDGTANSNIATINITMSLHTNRAPIANAQSVAAVEDTAKAITLTGTDADGDALTYAIVTQPAHGALSGAAPNVTYIPAANYNGADSFTFKVNDGKVDSANATVSITVAAVNDAPVANNQSLSVVDNATLNITLTATDIEGSALTYTVLTQPLHGILTGTAPNLVYRPALGSTGADSFTFRASDGTTNSNTATISITASLHTNRAPIANAQSVAAVEDTVKAITLTGSDLDGDALTYAIVTQPAHGALSGAAPNVTYIPAANYNGADSFTFKVNDGKVDSANATVSITVAAVNDAPVANNQSLSVVDNATLNITLTATDIEGSALTYTVLTQPLHGILTGTAPNLVYRPALGSTGADSFTFRASDGTTNSNTATISITASLHTNRAPIANAQSVAAVEDTVKAITLTGSDLDGDALTYAIVTQPAHGALSGAAPNVTYIPAANYNGADSFTFKVNDGKVDSANATVSITVAAVNDAPVLAAIGSKSIAEGALLEFTLSATDVDGNALTYLATPALPSGSTLNSSTGKFSWTPTYTQAGTYNVTFTVSDGALTDSETISIMVTDVLQGPQAAFDIADNVSIIKGASGDVNINLNNLNLPGKIANFQMDIVYDPSVISQIAARAGTSLTTAGKQLQTNLVLPGKLRILSFGVNQNIINNGQIAVLTLNVDAAAALGQSIVTLQALVASDINGGAVEASANNGSIIVAQLPNQPPVAKDISAQTQKDKAVNITLQASDADNDVLTYKIAAQPLHGTVSVSGNIATYVPARRYSGGDSFQYKANDGKVDSVNTATVSITVINGKPKANPRSAETILDQPVDIILLGEDPDLDVLTYKIIAQPTQGTVTLIDSKATYTPKTGYSGTDTFQYVVNDGLLDSDPATVTVQVIQPNIGPKAYDVVIDAQEDKLTNIDLKAEGTDLTYQVVSKSSHGNAVINDSKSPKALYLSVWNYNGLDSFTYKVVDGNGVSSNEARVGITVKPVNDQPLALGGLFFVRAGDSIKIKLNAGDVEGQPLTYRVTVPAKSGSVSIVGNIATYTSQKTSAGQQDNFSFVANDGQLDSNVAMVTIGILANYAPVASSWNIATWMNKTVGILLIALDRNLDPLTFSIVSKPAHGTVVLPDPKVPKVIYTPNTGYVGADSFTFKANDNLLDSNVATINIKVIR